MAERLKRYQPKYQPEFLYSILQSKKTNDHHAFISKKIENVCSITSEDSLCKEMKRSDGEIVFQCLSKNDIRKEAANIGNTFCGNCSKKLFKTE